MLAKLGPTVQEKMPRAVGGARRGANERRRGAGRIGARLGPNWAPLFLFLDC
jgi:hypothetical protein